MLYIRKRSYISMHSQEIPQLLLYVIYKKVSSFIFRTVTVGVSLSDCVDVTTRAAR
jgi:hypothetical protein